MLLQKTMRREQAKDIITQAKKKETENVLAALKGGDDLEYLEWP